MEDLGRRSVGAMAGPLVEVIEYTDPVCSWAWGSEPKLRLLRWRHGVPNVPLPSRG